LSRLLVSAIVVVRDELSDALLELTWQIVVVEQDAVFHRSMIPRERGFLLPPPHSMTEAFDAQKSLTSSLSSNQLQLLQQPRGATGVARKLPELVLKPQNLASFLLQVDLDLCRCLLEKNRVRPPEHHRSAGLAAS
jgi:hypothetical protein